MATAKPVHKIRAGSISCALWENDIRVGNVTKTVLKCTVERRFKDASGDWKSSGSYGRNEIPLVIWCLQKALDHIIDDNNTGSDENSIQEEIVA